MSSVVRESLGTRASVAFVDGGEVRVKNIDRPIRVWHWHPDDGATQGHIDARRAPRGTPENPSIAVLPFENMSGDPE